MYPSQLFSLFPPFPRENKVFVAMSFDPRFDERWEKVIRLGIRRVTVKGTNLEARRVDTRKVSDSILTEILTGISNYLLVFADITSLGLADGKPIRNGNIMYEVGLAHAVRLPEEVILFRSDEDPLLFDVAHVRVNYYDPDNKHEESQERVANAVLDAIKELDLRRNLAVQRAVDSLDFAGWNILLSAQDEVRHPVVRNMGDALGHASAIAAISRLLDMGILQTQYTKVTPEQLTQNYDMPVEELVRYRITSFGKVVDAVCRERLRLTPDLVKEVKKIEDTLGEQNKS